MISKHVSSEFGIFECCNVCLRFGNRLTTLTTLANSRPLDHLLLLHLEKQAKKIYTKI